MIEVDRFGSAKESQDVAYHLNGLIEANAEIKRLARRLDSAYGKNAKQTAIALSLLEVELYEHLTYHLKELRRSLAQLRASAYKTLEKQEGPSTEEDDLRWIEELLRKRRADLEAKRPHEKPKQGSGRSPAKKGAKT